jgi:hypothetical protein
VHHRYQPHEWQICHRSQWHQRRINNTGGISTTLAANCATGINNTGGKCLPPVSLVLLIPVSRIQSANLPSVSTTPVETCHGYQRHRQQWEQYQTADNLKWTWRKKFICMLTLLPQRSPKEIMKTFLIEDFFHLPTVSTTPTGGALRAANIFANFWKTSKRRILTRRLLYNFFGQQNRK